MGCKVGDSLVRIDGAVKVTGQASYTADIQLPGMLYGKILGSPHAHARIKNVNLEKAKKSPGVRAVMTGMDFPYLHGECIINIPFLAIDKVRYVGEPVVAVAAEDLVSAEEALEKVEVEYEELPAVFDPEEALKEGALLIHEDLGKYKVISAVHPIPGTNICQHFVLSLGNMEKGFQQSDYIFEDRFTTPKDNTLISNPMPVLPRWKLQAASLCGAKTMPRIELAKRLPTLLASPNPEVRVLTGYVGGSFGGKGGLKPEAVAVALAHKVRGRPVKVVFSRAEVFTTVTRMGCVLYLKTGVRKDGTLLARQVRLIWDSGAYAEKGPTISKTGGKLAAGPYAIPNVEIESFTVFTNKPMAGAMRGYGSPQVAFAYESQMDIIAEKLGMNPLDLRIKNAVGEGSKVVTGQRLYHVGLNECLERVGEEFYNRAEGAPDTDDKVLPYGNWVKGKGIACVYKTTKTPTVSAAYVKIDEDGSASILTSTVEVGQGSHTVLLQIVADILGLEQDSVTVSFADTDVTPYDTSTTASRSTFHMGNAVRMAAEDVKRQMLALAAPLLNVPQSVLQLSNSSVLAPDGRSLPIAQVLKTTFGAGAGAALLGQGVYTPKDILGLEDVENKELEAFSSLSVFHSYAVQGAEVAVDLDTGMVRVLRMVAVQDVGKAINPRNCRQQAEGGLGMSLGYGLMEEILWKNGRVLNPDFLDYRVPTALDCPPMAVFLVEKAHPQGPFGAKGTGEIASVPGAPAIANAVYNACGVRIRDLPLKPAKILQALRKL